MTDAYYVFRWTEIATDDLCRELENIAGVTDGPVPEVGPLVLRILPLVGGMPAARAALSPDECTALGRRLLHEACRHTLAALRMRVERRGYVPQGNRVVDVARLNVNSASIAELEALHGVGASIAQRIVEERLTNGMFRSFREFDDRVKGIGTSLAQALRHALSFDTPDQEWYALPYDATDLGTCLGILISITRRTDGRSGLLRALEIMASTCAASPHPAVREKRIRDHLTHDTPLHTTDAVTVLASTGYYTAAIERFDAANTSIGVCMFHIALPDDRHPTRRLLDALIRAKDRNVSVRVLVDLDKKSDPYRSEIINRPALNYLAKNGVRCRSDDRERLLHSKFVVIDDTDVIVGSHNWSAGSYFQFDDASVMVTSPGFATLMSQRFNALWNLTPPDHVPPD